MTVTSSTDADATTLATTPRIPREDRSRSAVADRVSRTAVTALAPVVWGTTYAVTTEFLPAGHPLFAGLLRALPAGLLALAITRTLPRGRWWARAAALGVLNVGMFFPLLFVAAERLPGGVAATLGATQPLIVALLAVYLLGEPLSRWRVGWGIVGVAGVGLVVIGPTAALDAVGVVAGLGGAAGMATGVVLAKRWGRPAGVTATAFAGCSATAGLASSAACSPTCSGFAASAACRSPRPPCWPCSPR
jgi:probable blue pigment (indigoidine) exporter